MVDMFVWIKTNWSILVEGIAYIVTGASILTKLTPSKADDIWIAQIMEFLALNKR